MSYNGTLHPAAEWIATREPHGKTVGPSFVKYSPNSPDNDFHLSQDDKSARKAGVSLSQYFTIDKDDQPRPNTSGWSIGAYEK